MHPWSNSIRLGTPGKITQCSRFSPFDWLCIPFQTEKVSDFVSCLFLSFLGSQHDVLLFEITLSDRLSLSDVLIQ